MHHEWQSDRAIEEKGAQLNHATQQPAAIAVCAIRRRTQLRPCPVVCSPSSTFEQRGTAPCARGNEAVQIAASQPAPGIAFAPKQALAPGPGKHQKRKSHGQHRQPMALATSPGAVGEQCKRDCHQDDTSKTGRRWRGAAPAPTALGASSSMRRATPQAGHRAAPRSGSRCPRQTSCGLPSAGRSPCCVATPLRSATPITTNAPANARTSMRADRHASTPRPTPGRASEVLPQRKATMRGERGCSK